MFAKTLNGYTMCAKNVNECKLQTQQDEAIEERIMYWELKKTLEETLQLILVFFVDNRSLLH